MQSLSRSAVSSVLQLALSFVAIVIVLATARIGYEAFKGYQSSDTEVAQLMDARKAFDAWRKGAESDALSRVDALQAESAGVLERRIADIDARLAEPAQSGTFSRILNAPSISAASDALLQSVVRDAQVELLKREREIVVQMRDFRVGKLALLEREAAFLDADAKVKLNRYMQDALLRDHPVLARAPLTAKRAELARLDQEHNVLSERRTRASAAYERQRAVAETLRLPERVRERVAQAAADAQYRLDRHIGERERANLGIDQGIRTVKSVSLTAALILAGIVLVPIGIKFVFYYVLAPLAARRPPICLLPDASGALAGLPERVAGGPNRATVSSVSLPLSIRPDEVLLVHPDFLQSSGAGTRMKTQWILDWKYPFASLAAGMRMLIRIRADRDGVVVVSATQDPLTEVGVLSLPEGASFVLFPRNLVGAVHPAGVPLRITSAWRIWSVHAWLTLQMRYLVFHGPAQLIVRGCRGVRVEPADTGRRINQAATIGWSANLHYKTTRSETFAAYLFGQRDLLNDSFAGGDGYFVYEEIPDRRRAGGIMGRGLEGMTDTVLKVFGV